MVSKSIQKFLQHFLNNRIPKKVILRNKTSPGFANISHAYSEGSGQEEELARASTNDKTIIRDRTKIRAERVDTLSFAFTSNTTDIAKHHECSLIPRSTSSHYLFEWIWRYDSFLSKQSDHTCPYWWLLVLATWTGRRCIARWKNKSRVICQN